MASIKSEKFIVIGAGIGGLQIAALLSNIKPVLVLEKTRNIGGRARVIEHDGFLLDLGPHPIRFGQNSSIAQTLQDIGTPIDFVQLGTVKILLSNGNIDVYPAGGIKSVFKTKMVPKFKFLKFLLKIKKMSQTEIENLYDVSLKDWMDKEKLPESIKNYLIIGASAIMVCPYPERVSAGEMIDTMMKVLKYGSTYYPIGGWTSFFNPLIEKVKKSGGELRLGTEVQEIVVKDGKAIGVKVGKEFIPAIAVISTVPVQDLFKILNPKHTTPEFVEKCTNLKSTAGILIDFCLSSVITDMNGILMIQDPCGFGFSPSNLSPDTAPPEKQWLSFFSPLDIDDLKDQEKRELHTKKFRSAIIKYLPEIESKIEFERCLTLYTVDGVEVNISQHRKKRPGNEVPNIKHLWLTGDSVGGESSGGDIGHTSVRECFEKIKESLK